MLWMLGGVLVGAMGRRVTQNRSPQPAPPAELLKAVSLALPPAAVPLGLLRSSA